MSRPESLDPELRYRLLLDLARRINRSLDLQDLLSDLLASLRSALPYDAAGVFVLSRNAPPDPGNGTHLIVGMATVGFDEPGEGDPMLGQGRGIVGHVVRTGETVVCPDVRQDPRYVAGRRATLSEAAVPIVSETGVLGALDVESDRLDAFGAADLELLEFLAGAAALVIERAFLHRELLEKQRLEHQLRVAHEVQAGLLPASAPVLPGYDLAGVNLPTWAIGGDYYDFVSLEPGLLGVVVADVSGKGVPAALIMATFRAALRSELRSQADLLAVVEEIDRVLLECQGGAHYVTAVYGVLDPRTGRFRYVNCGHNPPLLLRAGGGSVLLDRGGTALGLPLGRDFESGVVEIRPGDTLALYTDGVVEPADGPEEFGPARLEAVLRGAEGRTAEEIVREVVSATRAFARREAYEDDFTLVVLKRLGETLPGARGKASRLA